MLNMVIRILATMHLFASPERTTTGAVNTNQRWRVAFGCVGLHPSWTVASHDYHPRLQVFKRIYWHLVGVALFGQRGVTVGVHQGEQMIQFGNLYTLVPSDCKLRGYPHALRLSTRENETVNCPLMRHASLKELGLWRANKRVCFERGCFHKLCNSEVCQFDTARSP